MSADVRVSITGLEDVENDNEYDDTAFTEASNDFQAVVEHAVRALWDAGASIKDIESELANVMESFSE
jgi:hypothetical protein